MNGEPDRSKPETPLQPPTPWPPTLWTLVLLAKQGDTPEAQEALSRLTEHYYRPLLGYLTGCFRDRPKAEEITHAFLHHLREKNRLGKFERRENKQFRAYLKTALANFIKDQPRPPPPPPIKPKDIPAPTSEPGIEFDRAIALELHQRCMTSLEQRFDQAGKRERLDGLRPYLLGDPPADGYAPLSGRLRMTDAAVRQALFRLRGDYLDRFQEQVRETVRNEWAEFQEETRYLMQLVPAALEEARLKP